MNTFKCTAHLLATVLSLSAFTGAFAQDAPPTPAQAQTQDTSWAWASTGKKADVATVPSVSQTEHLEIYFDKHEFGRMMVRVPASVTIKNHSKNPSKQMQKNKIRVSLVFDNDAPLSQTWGVVEFSQDAALPALTPQEVTLPVITPQKDSTKLYLKALQSRKLTLSYPDVSGNTVTVVFDLSEMKSQMDAHKEKVHHFGVMDGLGILAAAGAGLGM